jgi:hypothetical protein
MWLIWTVRLGAGSIPKLFLDGSGAYDAIALQVAKGGAVMAALAVAVIVLSFGRQTVWRWALLVLASCWAVYFLLSLVAGDEGPFFPTRFEPLVGLAVSALTGWWARGRLREHGEGIAQSR